MVKDDFAGAKYLKTKFDYTSKDFYKTNQMVSGRNEPCTIVQIIEILSSLFGMSNEDMCEKLWQNTLKLFNIQDLGPSEETQSPSQYNDEKLNEGDARKSITRS